MLTSVRRRRNAKAPLPGAAEFAQQPSAPVPGSASADLAQNQPGGADRQLALLPRQTAVRAAFARALRVPTDERTRRRDTDGAAKVAVMLSQLDDRWHVLGGGPLNGVAATINPLVIGPAGVYCLSTRHHPGGSILIAGDLFMVDGRRYTYIAAARRLAADASIRLSRACAFHVDVTPVVVPVGADDFLIKRQPADVGIVTRARLSRWLGGQTVVLHEGQVAEIYAAARRFASWE